MTFESTVKKIKSLEIQGAENIAIAAVEAFGEKLKTTKNEALLRRYANELKNARATEPALRNAINYCLANYKTDPTIAKKALKHFKENQDIIAKNGAKLIRNGMKIFTHCHASTVERILIEAKNQGRKFEVYNTETRPRLQGRITATNLAKAGIKVTHCVDSAGRSLLRQCNLFLIGCDSITKSKKIINKIGTESLFDAANESKIPIYICTNSWKFDTESTEKKDTKIEERSGKEVWDTTQKNIKIYNPAFEKVDIKKTAGVISELGLLKPNKFFRQFKKSYKYLLQK
jgi:ribose 1,5-bisphosphate isomerase